MSIDNLGGDDNFRHTFQDDMESFFYVVLYASARWIAHDHVEDSERRLSLYFNENCFVGGRTQGGYAKLANVANGLFLRHYKWNNVHLNEWIKTVLASQKRTLYNRSEWTPESLFEVWVSTDTKTLPNDDRQTHALEPTEEGEGEPSFTRDSAGDMRSSRKGSKRSANLAGFEQDSNSSPKQRLRRSERLAKRKSRE